MAASRLLISYCSPPFVYVLSCLQDRIRALERDLRAVSSPVGPFNQRIAHYFAEALASRARGDGILKYATDIPRDREVSGCHHSIGEGT